MESAGVEKVLSKLRRSFAEGNFYEAHEMFKTVYFRHRSRGQLDKSYKLAEEGSMLQLTQGQINCGVELALLLLEAYEADAMGPSESSLQPILNIFNAFPRKSASRDYEPPVQDFLKIAIATSHWLIKNGGDNHIPDVQLILAEYIDQVLSWQGLGCALPHYAVVGNMIPLAKAILKAVSSGHPCEEDFFLARCTIYILTVGKKHQAERQLAAASNLLKAYEEVKGHGLNNSPLIHFLQLLLLALQHRSNQLLQVLLKVYRVSMVHDPTLCDQVVDAKRLHFQEKQTSSALDQYLK